MGKLVFLFDGQGAFRPGIGEEMYSKYNDAKEIMDKASEILDYDLKQWLWGDRAKETASKTSIAQPAISTISLAYAALLASKNITPTMSMGHSLGEVTAIIHCGILTMEDGLKVIQKRGELMERGGKEGTMMAIINIKSEKLQELCSSVSEETKQPVVIANINAPQQIVISGSKDSIQKVAQLVVKEHGRGIPLKVGGAWHSPFLKDASNEFAGFLDTISFTSPKIKFYSVVEQEVIDDPDRVKQSLKQQMLSRVDWVTAITKSVQLGYTYFLEIGPSKILKDLVYRINSNVTADSTALYTDIENLVEKI